MRAIRSFTDRFKKVRKSGDEWLITSKDTEAHIPLVDEEIVKVLDIITLTNRQYAKICDPVDDDGKVQLGKKTLVRGPVNFFLRPGRVMVLFVCLFLRIGVDCSP
jgi:major vault protein